MGDMHTTALSPTPLGSPLRAQFPILAQRINGQPLVYLDNAATTQMPLVVLDAMRQFETTARANIHRGVHTLSQRATDVFENARETVKRFVGATQAHELVFTSGTTEALNLVTQGLVHGLDGRTAAIGPGDEIIVSGLEHHANLVPWQQAAKRSGATLRILLPNAHGQLQADDLDTRLKTARDQAIRAVRGRAELTGEDGNTIHLGRHAFTVGHQALDLTLVPGEQGLAYHLTGTDYLVPLQHEEAQALKPFWTMALVSESATLYRAEYLAGEILHACQRGEYETTLDTLQTLCSADTQEGLLALVRESAPERMQGVAISMAQTVLIIFFAFAGFIFSFWMQERARPRHRRHPDRPAADASPGQPSGLQPTGARVGRAILAARCADD